MAKIKLKRFFKIMMLLYVLCAAVNPVFATEKRLAIFPFAVNSKEDIGYIRDGISSLLPSRIAVGEKITVIDSYNVRSELNKLPPDYPLAAYVAIGKKLRADYILVGSITKIGTNASLDTRLIETANPDAVTPFFIESLGLNDMLPQLTTFAEAVRKKILGEPEAIEPATASSLQLEQQPSATLVPQPSKESPRDEVPKDSDQAALEETEYQTVEQPRAEKKPPLFESTPFYSTTVSGDVLNCLAAGDVDGDGKAELVLSGNRRIVIYQWSGMELKQREEIKGDPRDYILRIDTGDTNKNGRDEIFVSCVGETAPNFFSPNSFILEQTDNSFNKIEKSQQWIFRIYQPPGKRAIILGQTAGETNPFANQIYKFLWKNGRLMMRNEFLIPESLHLYSFAQGDLDGDGRLEYIAFYKGVLSLNYQLYIFSSLGRMMWRDQQLKLGGEVNEYYKLRFNNEIREKEFLPLRVLCDDFNRDGRLDVIVARNTKQGNFLKEKIGQYNRGEVLCLHWDGYDLSPNWSSGILDGCIRDYGIFDFDGDQRSELFILSAIQSTIKKDFKNKLTVFKQAAASP